MINKVFRDTYKELVSRMKDRAEADGDVFLPNIEPLKPVNYVVICMEPSLGRWAGSVEEARSKVDAGFRNFISSIEGYILHFSIQHYLCKSTQRYHITDLSKGAMLVERAGIARTERYEKWYGLLVEELDLVALPGARIVAVGKVVAEYLQQRAFPRPFTNVIHYSGMAGRARAAGIVGREESFDEFKGSVSLEGLVATANEILKDIPATFRDEAIAQLKRSQLSESRQQLIFNYKSAFEAIGISG